MYVRGKQEVCRKKRSTSLAQSQFRFSIRDTRTFKKDEVITEKKSFILPHNSDVTASIISKQK